jgi:hypothetical protein
MQHNRMRRSLTARQVKNKSADAAYRTADEAQGMQVRVNVQELSAKAGLRHWSYSARRNR